MNMSEAFATYERVRHRLPVVQRDAECQRLPNLDAIADEIDVFLLDAFGVLNIGETSIQVFQNGWLVFKRRASVLWWYPTPLDIHMQS